MVAVVAKAIKPKRLKEKEMRLELLNGMRSVAKDIKKDFEATTKTWKHKPKFETVISLAGKGPAVLVGSDDPIYRYVDEGTKPHAIFPKKKRALAFRGGYRAKTKPGVIGSSGGGASGDVVFSKGVHHPGTKARKFSHAIEKKWGKAFKRRMEESMTKAAKKSGYGI